MPQNRTTLGANKVILFRNGRLTALSFAWGVVVSGIVYVNLAGYHVKAVRRDLAGRASGVFVTSLYVSAAFAGYVMGWIANRAGWGAAGTIQISACSLAAATLAIGLRFERR